MRAQGGASRNADRSPKHALSLRFRREYGAGRLNYPIIENSPLPSYDTVHLRARYNNSWIHRDSVQRQRAQFTRDQWARDAMIDMGTPSAGHGNYAHLYLNGLYWGIYVLQERMDNPHYAEYYGGHPSEIDVVNGGRATNGDLKSYNAMRQAARAKDWDEVVKRLDVDSYIDWHIVQRFGSNRDWKNNGNWKAVGGGPHDMPWRFYAWDTERILEGVRQGAPTSSQDPSTIFNSLEDIPEFAQRFADRLHKHLFNGGALTPEENIARYRRRAQELDLAIIAESARWGDHRRSAPYQRDQEWVAERDRLLQDYFPQRTEEVIAQYKGEGLYPPTLGVDLNQFGGRVPEGFNLRLSSKGDTVFNPGKLYYTVDGTDPRAADGSISSNAIEYETPLQLDESLIFKARTLSARQGWSALTETFFAVGTREPTSQSLVISEVMYHPGPPTAEESANDHVDSDDFEYIELHNVGDKTLDLAGVTFDTGVRFTFPAGLQSILAPGATAVIVADEAAFRFRYAGGSPGINGIYRGSLDNDGEAIRLLAADDTEILSFSYGDGGSWPRTADGIGFSLVLVDPEAGADPDKGATWRASASNHGSPGRGESPVDFTVVINEILSNSEPPDVDAIELFNQGSHPVDVSGWFLTDDADEPRKYPIAAGSFIPAGGYLVILQDDDADQANNDALPAEFFGNAFGLSSRGDSVYLFSANAEGALTGYNDGFSFGAADEGVTFGRQIDSQGRVEYSAQMTSTLGGPNSEPMIGPVVISEIMYHSTHSWGSFGDAGEYLELVNRSGDALSLGHWRLGGIDYTFPEEAKIAAGEVILVSRFGAERFSQWYATPADVRIFGPHGGRLSNDGEQLTLYRPGESYLDDGVEKTAMITVDSVRYNDADPWPAMADGQGRSLERRDLGAYADEVTNWKLSAEDQGSPGRATADVDPGPEPEPTGMTFAQWQGANFSADQLGSPSLVGPFADPDRDGLVNRVEFALGSHPLESGLIDMTAERERDSIEIRFQRRRSLTGVRITLQASTDLKVWQELGDAVTVTSVTPIDAHREGVSLSWQPGDAARFLRLAVDEF